MSCKAVRKTCVEKCQKLNNCFDAKLRSVKFSTYSCMPVDDCKVSKQPLPLASEGYHTRSSTVCFKVPIIDSFCGGWEHGCSAWELWGPYGMEEGKRVILGNKLSVRQRSARSQKLRILCDIWATYDAVSWWPFIIRPWYKNFTYKIANPVT